MLIKYVQNFKAIRHSNSVVSQTNIRMLVLLLMIFINHISSAIFTLWHLGSVPLCQSFQYSWRRLLWCFLLLMRMFLLLNYSLCVDLFMLFGLVWYLDLNRLISSSKMNVSFSLISQFKAAESFNFTGQQIICVVWKFPTTTHVGWTVLF